MDGINGLREILPLLRREDPEAHTPVVLLGVANPQNARVNRIRRLTVPFLVQATILY